MSQISSATAVNSAIQDSASSGFAALTSEEFIRVIFTELTNQDPLEPSDTGALLDQLNSIRSIESDLQLTRQLEALVTENQLASASNMIGKFIGGHTQNFQRATGYVVSAVRQGDDIMLELDTGWFVPIENVDTIIDPSIFPDAEPTPTDDTPPTSDVTPSPGSGFVNPDANGKDDETSVGTIPSIDATTS